MKILKCEDSEVFKNSDVCSVREYSFGDKDLDLGISTIDGRYPSKGYSVNEKSKMIIYILEGKGRIVVDEDYCYFEQGDVIMINPMEKYYWDTEHCVASIVSTPAWSSLQYKVID